ncbi:MAG: ROK family protein [Lachnospiraceae bacterium]|nr:ROK family protein [Lachnospiraceae bacterium]
MKLGALEAGGTKMVVAIGNEKGEIFEKKSIPTTMPQETISEIIAFFQDKNIEALGIGSFGPIDVREDSENYGRILDTPKLHWRQYDLLKPFQETLKVPVKLDTDVNGSCLGEMTFGSAKGLKNVIYITIGTGIGVGAAVEGKLLHGMLHPEAGHILIRKNPQDKYQGKCPYHKTCFEGLAAGPAIEERYGKSPLELINEKEVWELEADYIAQALMNYILILSPERIILGGGVMHQEQLFPIIRKKTAEYMAGYLKTEQLENMESYIVPPSLNDNQGILGALKLAAMALS